MTMILTGWPKYYPPEVTKRYWVIDDNFWTKSKYSYVQALEYSETLLGCKGCTDCINCTDCQECVKCINCTDCLRSIDCKDSVGLYSCQYGCISLYNCICCSDATNCVKCTNCSDVEGLVHRGYVDSEPEPDIMTYDALRLQT